MTATRSRSLLLRPIEVPLCRSFPNDDVPDWRFLLRLPSHNYAVTTHASSRFHVGFVALPWSPFLGPAPWADARLLVASCSKAGQATVSLRRVCKMGSYTFCSDTPASLCTPAQSEHRPTQMAGTTVSVRQVAADYIATDQLGSIYQMGSTRLCPSENLPLPMP